MVITAHFTSLGALHLRRYRQKKMLIEATAGLGSSSKLAKNIYKYIV